MKAREDVRGATEVKVHCRQTLTHGVAQGLAQWPSLRPGPARRHQNSGIGLLVMSPSFAFKLHLPVAGWRAARGKAEGLRPHLRLAFGADWEARASTVSLNWFLNRGRADSSHA